MENLLNALKAAAEATRLRIVGLLRSGELTVSELTQILRQSQPRVSRHLKLLTEAGLIERHPEGTWVFYRLADSGPAHRVAQMISSEIDNRDADFARDLDRLAAVKATRAEAAAAYFAAVAPQWDRLRALHVAEEEVENRLLARLKDAKLDDFLDVGTGTARMLSLFADRIGKGVGIDLSHDMLQLARTRLEKDGHDNCQVRLGDMYSLPFEAESQDAVLFHQVLHYADEPQAAIREAARILRPNGHLLVVDFAPHQDESLRTHHAHRRLGFEDTEMSHWADLAGLTPSGIEHLAGGALTVTIWHFTKAAAASASTRPHIGSAA